MRFKSIVPSVPSGLSSPHNRSWLLIGGLAVAVLLAGGAAARARPPARSGAIPPYDPDSPPPTIRILPGQPLPSPVPPAPRSNLPPLPSTIEPVPNQFRQKGTVPAGQQDFVRWSAEYALYVQRRTGLHPSVVVAMALAGRQGVTGHNFFGVDLSKRPPRFRFWDGRLSGDRPVYPHPWYSFMHFAELLYFNAPAYDAALGRLELANPEPFARQLAYRWRNTAYGDRIVQLINNLGLRAYDNDQPRETWWLDANILGSRWAAWWRQRGARFAR